MSKPETVSNEAHVGPDGSIFLPTDTLTVRKIDTQLFEMLLSRGELGALELEKKIERAAMLNAQRVCLADLAINAS